jgi:hypothetical protein
VTERQVYKTRTFARWVSKITISDAELLVAVEEVSLGLIDAQLGGSLVKKRVALNGKGKRSGGRTLIATNLKDRWVFLYGFEKNERENITLSELTALRELAKTYIELGEDQLNNALMSGELVEVKHDTETEKQNSERSAGIGNRPAKRRRNQQT